MSKYCLALGHKSLLNHRNYTGVMAKLCKLDKKSLYNLILKNSWCDTVHLVFFIEQISKIKQNLAKLKVVVVDVLRKQHIDSTKRFSRRK